MNTPQRVLPVPTDITRAYWEGAAAGKLLIQHCQDCGHHQFFPRPFCLACMSGELAWKATSGKGTIYTFTVNHRPAHASLAERVPYVVAMIDLDEGVRMMANLLDAPPAKLAIGKRVRVVFETLSDTITLPQFVLDAD